jgi:hypothetical protein
MGLSSSLSIVSAVSPAIVNGALNAFYYAHGVFPIHDLRESFLAAAGENSLMLRGQQRAYNNYSKFSDKECPEALEAKKLSGYQAKKVLEHRRLIHIQPTTWESHLHRQILKHEKVHPLKNQRNLVLTRFGMEGMNKDCQAIIVDSRRGRFILANIFRFHVAVPEVKGLIDVRMLPGNVDDVKASPITQLQGDENVTMFYSISSVLPGAGRQLIFDLPKDDKLKVTLSPVRGFTSKHDRSSLLLKSDDEIRLGVLKYLQNKNDGVRNFHVGNGAYLAWIHINRDAPKDSEDWITVNYLYDATLLQENKTMFNRGKGVLPVSPILYHMSMHAGMRDVYSVTNEAMVSRPNGFNAHI